MDKEQTTRVIIATMIAVSTSKLQLLVPLTILLGILMVIDILYGLRASAYEHTNINSDVKITSESMMNRIIKKFSELLLIPVGLVLDLFIYYIADILGASINIQPIFALIIVISLVGKELISIVENYTRCGNEPPKWLGRLGEVIRDSAESKGERYVDKIKEDILKDE